MKRDNISSLAHSKWNCKYHVVLVPKHRRKVFYGTQRLEIGQILKQFCNWYGATMFVEMSPKHLLTSLGESEGKEQYYEL